MSYKDKETRLKYQREWVAKRRADFFQDKFCVVCGSTERLRLDHIDPSTKTNHRIWSWREERRLAEIAKCQVLCEQHHIDKTITNMEHAYGESKASAKISEAQASEIRNSNLSTKQLALKFNLNRRTIQRIRSNELWKHLVL